MPEYLSEIVKREAKEKQTHYFYYVFQEQDMMPVANYSKYEDVLEDALK